MSRQRIAAAGWMGAVALAFLTLASTPSWADPPTRAVRLSFVAGDVSLAPANLPDDWTEAIVNRPLTDGDRLWAARGSRAELRAGSTAIRLDGGTGLDLLDFDERRVQASVDQGRVQVRTRGGEGGDAEIDTPAAAIVVDEAAEITVAVEPQSGGTDVTVRQGRVAVHTARETISAVAGDVLRIAGDGSEATLDRAGAPDAFETFAASRDARWREPRYVSREMTGYEDLETYGTWRTEPSYGNVWYPANVRADWAPYRDGRWVWVEPWGWSWVDDAPWGFAPFHYGRWVYAGSRWGWVPGAVVARPVYAPALVAFYGGSNFGVSLSIGSPAVGWFPLGFGDPYVPWYTASPAYRRSVNVAYVRDPVVLNRVVNVNVTNVTTINDYRYAYRDSARAVTVVSSDVFVGARPVRTAAVRVEPARLRTADLVVGASPAAPERRSVLAGPGRSGERDVRARPVVAVNAPPPAPARFDQREAQVRGDAGKPFEVKPIAPRDVRRAEPRGATTVASTDANREVRVIKPAAATSTAQMRTREPERANDRTREASSPKPPERTARDVPPNSAPPKPSVPSTAARTARVGNDRARNAQREAEAPPASPDRQARAPASDAARGRNDSRASTPSPAPAPQASRQPPAPQAARPQPERHAAPRTPQPSPQAAAPQERRASAQAEAPRPAAQHREAAPQPQREAASPERRGKPADERDERAQGEHGRGRSG